VSARSERSEPRSRELGGSVSARSERSEPRSREPGIPVSATADRPVLRTRGIATNKTPMGTMRGPTSYEAVFVPGTQRWLVTARDPEQHLVRDGHRAATVIGTAAGRQQPLAHQRVDRKRQRGHKRFSFTRFHLGDGVFQQGQAADELHVKMAHL
jgi:hypothetical protein